jgi:hypothetical protein
MSEQAVDSDFSALSLPYPDDKAQVTWDADQQNYSLRMNVH